MTQMDNFSANLANSARWNHQKHEGCAKCGRWLNPTYKTTPSGVADMPKMHLRGVCQRIDRFQVAARIESADVEATRVMMARRSS
jgi:hypothetical protein